MKTALGSILSLSAGILLGPQPASCKEALEPAGTLPVLHEVDVVVVGGSSGGVAAATAAARDGAKVFLAAPRPYLGEDICATYRLWLEPDEAPATDLARQVFKASPETAVLPVGHSVPFRYTSDRAPAATHKDTSPPSRLTDEKWQSASQESVQYDGDVTLRVDLGKEQPLTAIHLLVYQRPADFVVNEVAVSTSMDQKVWEPLTTIRNSQPNLQAEDEALPLTAKVSGRARYLQLAVRKATDAKRVLLAEIVVEDDTSRLSPPTSSRSRRAVTPMQVKRTLDQALILAGVPFLYGSHATDILHDAQGKPAGVVIENRSGRQAVLAKVIIDATESGNIARMAKAKPSPAPQATRTFTRVVIGGEPRQHDMLTLRSNDGQFTITDRKGRRYPVHEYQIQSPPRDDSFATLADFEQLARDWTWSKDAVDASESLFTVESSRFVGKQPHSGPWPGAEKLPLECLQPAGTERLFLLGPCADVSRETAAVLARPVNQMAVGERAGLAAARLAAGLPKPEGVHRAGDPATQPVPGEVRTQHGEASPRLTTATIPADAQALPVLGSYDVVVVGGGTGGAPAGIGAGRHGAKTLLIESLHGLGGVGTLGYISTYYHGNRVGFTAELDRHVTEIGGPDAKPNNRSWNPEHKSEAYRQQLRKAGVDVWFGCSGSGALVENGRVTGVVVLTPHGRGVVLAKVVVDSTGNADIAAAAGAPCRYTDATDVAVQGTGLPPRELGQKYTNTDYTFVDDTDIFDLWRVLVVAKQKFKNSYDLGQLIDTRERRQIVGDFILSPMDMVLGRTQPDTVVIARSNFDTHGYIIHPMFMIRPPHRASIDVRVPYRCLLPRGLDGILVTGLGVSAHRDALPCIRMQPDVQNQGYAAGTAAAMIASQGCTTRQLDIKALQKHLIEIGNLPPDISTEQDSFPLPKEQVAAAVQAVAKDYDKLEVVMAQFDTAQPLLREAFQQADSDAGKLAYAHVLGMMGDATGAKVLAKTVTAAAWDEGWRFKGMGQFGASMSPLDSYLIALGRTKSPAALQPILDKASKLDASSAFSHFRAVAIALETLGDKAAAQPLARLLQVPGIGGHAVTDIKAALAKNPASDTDNLTRDRTLTELYLARALYRCGDHQGIGRKILEQFSQDLHGHYARHARAVLRQNPGNTTR